MNSAVASAESARFPSHDAECRAPSGRKVGPIAEVPKADAAWSRQPSSAEMIIADGAGSQIELMESSLGPGQLSRRSGSVVSGHPGHDGRAGRDAVPYGLRHPEVTNLTHQPRQRAHRRAAESFRCRLVPTRQERVPKMSNTVVTARPNSFIPRRARLGDLSADSASFLRRFARLGPMRTHGRVMKSSTPFRVWSAEHFRAPGPQVLPPRWDR